MEKYKKLKLTLITLLLALAVAFTAAAFAFASRGMTAYAATEHKDRFVELDGNSVFYTAIRGAEISTTEPENDTATHYTLFKIGKEETISYRQNLAYKWIRNTKDSEGNYLNVPEEKHFSIKLKFPSLSFKNFYIRFESQQYTLTKDGKSTNYLVFTADGENVKIGVSTTAEKDGDKITEITEVKEIGTAAKDGEILIELDEYSQGDYAIKLNGENTEGAFKNVNEDYASYVASGDSAVTPITFGAIFDEDDQVAEAEMVLMDISGQSFEMHKDGDVYKIKDTAAPVLCFSQTPAYLEYGKSIGFQYSVIDVLANVSGNSSRATAYYYVLTGEQVADNDFEYDRIDYEPKKTDDEQTGEGEEGESGEGEGEGETTKQPTSPFKKITTASSDRIYSDKNTFVPSDYLKSDVMGLVKIYYELSDYATASMANTDVVFVDWYLDNAVLEDVTKYNSQKTDGTKFLKLIKGKEGATYARYNDVEDEEPLEAYKQSVIDFQTAYQDKIDAAIEALEDGKLYAGGNKFYLPAIEYDFLDGYLNATDLKYSLYYRGANSGSHTLLSYNKLAIDLNDADVTYRFTIYVTDAFNNPMRYPTNEKDEYGRVVWKEITSGDVWDEDFAELLPYFEFEVSYKEATAEPPENLSISYVKSNYSGVSFKITGVSGTYTSNYKLYVFDRNAYYKDTQEVLDYDTFVSKTKEIFDNPDTRRYFTTVKPVKDLLESDENYELFKALNWNASSVTFTPQSVEDFYVLELQLTDNRSLKSDAYYATVASSVQANSLKGESESWIENNKTSVILFVVAGVCLVALIVLLVIKPKDKGDIDAVYSEVESKDKSKNKNKK